MHPILFEIPGTEFPLRSFGLLVVLGFLLGAHVYGRLGRKYSPDPDRDQAGFAAIPIWVLVGILVGARLMYVIVEILRGSETGKGYLSDPLSVLFYWQGGLVMYGGMFGAVLAGWWGIRKHKLPVWHAVDLAVVCCFLGLAVGRIGCLAVGDDFGRIVPEQYADLPFPIVVRVPTELPEGSLFTEGNAGQTLWATQIWMSLNALFLALLGAWWIGRRRYAGQVTLGLFLLYTVGRSAIEVFRGDEVRGVWAGGLSTSQIISIALALVCVVLIFRNRKLRDAVPPA
ncbi:MAG: prolipoprotein diacylglyceryl transferase [bacterium]|nr:prolipoprotein diacylglyceryl transferase [bacterium]